MGEVLWRLNILLLCRVRVRAGACCGGEGVQSPSHSERGSVRHEVNKFGRPLRTVLSTKHRRARTHRVAAGAADEMSSLVVANHLLTRRCSLWRSACRPLMMAAIGQPRVTQDPSRGGQVTIAPADAASHTATFVGPIHGLGDTNQGWMDVGMHLHQQLPHVKFVLPNAPTMPVTLNMGMPMPSWYDITSLDDRANQPW